MDRMTDLTSREYQIAGLVAEGLTNKEIGGRIGLREQTVKNHLRAAMQKTGSHGRARLAAMYALNELRRPA